MQFMVSRRLVRLGGVDRGVDPPYRQKKTTKKKRAATAAAYILCVVRRVAPPLSKDYSSLLNYPFVSGAQIWPILLILQF